MVAQAGGFGYCVATGKTKRCSSLESVAVINVPVTPHLPHTLCASFWSQEEVQGLVLSKGPGMGWRQ